MLGESILLGGRFWPENTSVLGATVTAFKQKENLIMHKQPLRASSIYSSLIILAIVCVLSAGYALAQNTGAGTITGTLTDPNGGVVPAAAIAVRNTGTNTTKALATNADGIYVAPFLTPGTYEITASKAGFAKVVRTDLTLQVGQTLTIDLALPLQTTTETVTVTGQPSVVDTEKTEMSQVVSQTAKENLPLAGRRWENFALLTPNATTDGSTGLVSYRGISALYNSSAIDGTNNNQAFFSESKGRSSTGLPYVYSMDSIQEFQVTSSNYSAELGQAAGGVINAVTKSGTNALHGDLFYYLRYPTWNALDPVNKSKGIYSQPVHQQQQFGGSVGGPIIKDKLFYFLTYDGSRKVAPITYTSSATFPLACPAAVAATLCASANNFFKSQLTTYPKNVYNDVAFGKLDYLANAKNHVNASFNFDNFHSPNAYGTSTTNPNSSVTQSGAAVSHERIFVASWDSTISPTMINTFRFQWSRDLEIFGANGSAPGVTITNVIAYGLPNALPRPAFPDEHRLQFADVLSKNVGHHTFKAGLDFNAIHEVLINLFNGGGVYTYSGGSAFANWVADATGTNLGDGLTGRHFTLFTQVTDPVTGVGKDDFYDKDFGAFVEDSWKVRPNLTLNLGVRYDIQLIPQPPKPNTATPLTTLYSSTINIDKNNFAPRFGLAWSIGKGNVLRAGYGIFYGQTSNSTYYAQRVENGSFQQTYNCTVTTCPALAFPNVIFVPPGSAPQAPFPGALVPRVTPVPLSSNTATARGMTPDWVNPLVHEGEVTFEHQLPGNSSISASYVVSRALHLPTFIDTNLKPATTTRSYDITNTAGATQSTVTVPFYTARIDPTGAILTGFSDVNSWYNSLVLTYHKRMSGGVEFVANYTLSKAVDGGQVAGYGGTFSGTDLIFDPQNRKLEYGRSDLDQRQRFVGNVVWAPTYANKIANKPLRLIASGFTFSSIVLVSTGQPIASGSTAQVGATINGFPSGGADGGLTGGLVSNSGGGTGGPVPGPRNTFTGPGVTNVDLRISREFAYKERVRLSLAGDAFNLFNFTNFYSVNNTEYNYTAAGSGACAGHSNGCLVANPAFLSPLTSNNNLSGARQLQVSAKITF